MSAPRAFDRRAPYAPISALHEFFLRIKDIGVPSRVDRSFLQKLNVASNNEWALLSALKFLGIVDQQGRPSHAYRLLQTEESFQGTLRHLVQTAYEPLFDHNGLGKSLPELIDYFRLTSSASQAKNAARFFREMCVLSGIRQQPPALIDQESVPRPTSTLDVPNPVTAVSVDSDRTLLLLQTKARLLEKLPASQPDWSAAEYENICARFLELLQCLE